MSVILELRNQGLTELPPLPDNLEVLDCRDNALTSLPALPPRLQVLKCSHNQITVLPDLPPKLTVLECDHNRIAELPVRLPSKLTRLICSRNQIETLPRRLPSALTVLEVSFNRLTGMSSLSHLAALKRLDCGNNPEMRRLPTPPSSILSGLEYLKCNDTGLKSLPRLPYGLLHLECQHNSIKELPEPFQMQTLNASSNPLTKLPKLPHTLRRLYLMNISTKLTPDSLRNLAIAVHRTSDLEGRVRSLEDVRMDQRVQAQLTAWMEEHQRGEAGRQARLAAELARFEGLIRRLPAARQAAVPKFVSDISKLTAPSTTPLRLADRTSRSPPKEYFDIYMASQVPVADIDFSDSEQLFFHSDSGSVPIIYPRTPLMTAFKDRSGIFVGCTRPSRGAVSVDQVNPQRVYFKLILLQSHLVPVRDMQRVLEHPEHPHWRIRSVTSSDADFPVEESYTASLGSVHLSGDRNVLMEGINIVSSDHCQEGTSGRVYRIEPIAAPVPSPPAHVPSPPVPPVPPVVEVAVAPKKRCPRGSHRNRRTGVCDPVAVPPAPPVDAVAAVAAVAVQQKRCPRGTRRNRRTRRCEPYP